VVAVLRDIEWYSIQNKRSEPIFVREDGSA
jgi:hypothetical protein